MQVRVVGFLKSPGKFQPVNFAEKGFCLCSRGDTADYADLDKLAKRFLKGEQEGLVNRPTKAFVEEVVKDLQTGQKGECPICLESMEDAVLTPCAHRLCRDCLFASWRSYGGGPCPICR